ncbi:MAG: arsenite methyltransferase [Firmicutes bacterium]|nr:arsenite methyltransferase [Bacillota bacterium]
MTLNPTRPDKEAIRDAVTSTYGAVARSRHRTQSEAACCGPQELPLLDYSTEEIASVPPGAYLGEGSGNPVRFAGLAPGETVVDLGAGAGMDSFLAANRVGPAGSVYGFDLTPEMVDRARRIAAAAGIRNVRFELADIEHLPLAEASVDVAISNCVINLTPDKRAVYREIFRVLRPGGRISVADIVLRGTPEAVAAFRTLTTTENWCACVAGALREEDYLAILREVGFTDVQIVAERAGQIQPGGDVRSVAITLTARKPA